MALTRLPSIPEDTDAAHPSTSPPEPAESVVRAGPPSGPPTFFPSDMWEAID